MLSFKNGESFATGLAEYQYKPATENETTPRICVQTIFEGISTLAVVDTGSPFTILDPQVAEFIDIDLLSGSPSVVEIRGVKWEGRLHRLNVIFIANEGENTVVEATVFIPKIDSHQDWYLPSFIGYNSCLERLRFAVDPFNDTFYFGPISDL